MQRTRENKQLEFELERLEDRKMMAGDVTVNVSGSGNLTIVGDDLDNFIEISEVSENTIRIESLFGDTGIKFNGNTLSELEIHRDTWNDIRIRMGDGNDEVNVNYLNLNATEGSDLNIKMDDGADRVEVIHSSFNRDIRIDTGSNGQDQADDVIVWEAAAGRNLRIDMGGGADFAYLFASESGADTVVKAEHGSDRVWMHGLGVGDDLKIVLGNNGDDSLRLWGSTQVQGNTSLNAGGGDGTDQLYVYDDLNSFDIFTAATGFESVEFV